MHGNVNEWCFDRNPLYPAAFAPPTPDVEQADRTVHDKDQNDIRIYRGGSFADPPPMTRSAYRDGARPSNRFPAVGFRVARTIATE
jgi:formylglycine-generating enzyme required for sulfatase activity